MDAEKAFTIAQTYLQQKVFNTRSITQLHNLENVFDNIDKSIFLDAYHVTAIGHEAVADALLQLIIDNKYVGH
jgi:hypothetical protein